MKLERPWNLPEVVSGLSEARRDWRREHRARGDVAFPSIRIVGDAVGRLCAALFPVRLGFDQARRGSEDDHVATTLETALIRLHEQVRLELECGNPAAAYERPRASSDTILGAFAADLPDIRRMLDADVEAAYAGDPAARSVDEVLLCYPGVRAVMHHRIAHALHTLGAPLIARIVSEIAHAETGIDIHPGARIGAGFFIDHGTGVVIGETAVVGDRVRLYQAVTLGARTFPAASDGSLVKGLARHPIVEDDVVIYAGATILGRVTIGAGAIIGGSVWLTESVPAGAVIHQAFAERESGAGPTVPTGHVVPETSADHVDDGDAERPGA